MRDRLLHLTAPALLAICVGVLVTVLGAGPSGRYMLAVMGGTLPFWALEWAQGFDLLHTQWLKGEATLDGFMLYLAGGLIGTALYALTQVLP